MNQYAAKIIIRPDEVADKPLPPSSSPAPTAGLWLLTLIPFVNCWAWARHWSVDPARQKKGIAVAVLLGLYSVVAVLGAGLVVFWPRQPWLVRLAHAADYGVVKIQTSQGIGTGFVIASRGNRHLLLTNRHVITVEGGFLIFTFDSPENPCAVLLRTGEKLTGYLAAVPKDNAVDLALLLVESDVLRPLGKLRRFEEIQQGEPVAEIGHPLDYEFSIADGIVSRKWQGMYVLTNALINHGNSGGPLIDAEGKLLGVVTGVFKPDELSGIGVATRADYVLRTADWEYSKDVDVSDLLPQLKP